MDTAQVLDGPNNVLFCWWMYLLLKNSLSKKVNHYIEKLGINQQTSHISMSFFDRGWIFNLYAL